nr:hypothetical protein [uncultured bacterium]
MITSVGGRVILAHIRPPSVRRLGEICADHLTPCPQIRYLRRRDPNYPGQGVGAVAGSGSPKNPADV